MNQFRVEPAASSVRVVRTLTSAILARVTPTLDAAIARLASLPPEEQDRVARWPLEELRDDGQWDRQFARSQDVLGKLAKEAREEFARGTTTELDPEKL